MTELEFGMEGRLASLEVIYGESIELYIRACGSLTVECVCKDASDYTAVMNRDHAAALWPLLQCFAETGRLTKPAQESEATQ
jgi:hypothetical protein